MLLIRCPICERMFDPAASRAMPFCSEQCRLIDLGRWLKESYSVPVTRDPDDDKAGGEVPEPPE